MNLLILGGNRFFGLRFAKRMLARGNQVTLLNRGTLDDGLGSKVHRIRCDRTNASQLDQALDGKTYDAIIDQVCFTAQQARDACRIFENKAPYVIFTSTISTYDNKPKAGSRESDFDGINYQFTADQEAKAGYGEAKRQAEAVFFREAKFKVCAPRFPIVCGIDDYTERLMFHIEHVAKKQKMLFPNLEARMSYIDSEDAARCLEFLLDRRATGAVNCSSPDAISMRALLNWIEDAVREKAVLSNDSGDPSPYGFASDFFPNTELLQSLGLKLPPLREWLPKLIAEFAGKKEPGTF